MEIDNCNKKHRVRSLVMVMGILFLVLSMLVSTATAENVASSINMDKSITTYTSTPNSIYTSTYASSGVNLKIINKVGSNILVAWTKVNSRKSVFKVNVAKGKTGTVKVSPGTYVQYVRVGSSWYRLASRIIIKPAYVSGSITYYWSSTGSGYKIPNSQAPI
jgi:hypothetical protein